MTANQVTGWLAMTVLVAVGLMGVLGLDAEVAAEDPPPAAPSVDPRAVARPAPPQVITYEVEPGDTLSSIAALFGMTPDDVLAHNELDSPDRLTVGQELRIVVGSPADPGAPGSRSSSMSP
jgi:LysM repeat protein